MIKDQIESKLTNAFAPVYLSVENESHGHNVKPGAESHFKLVIVSDVFEDVRPVQQHQKVYQVLADELKSGVHALAIHTYTPAQWQASEHAPDSPPCMGGSKK